jgi:anti-sigma-K factor RskA
MSIQPDHSEWYELVAGHALHALDAHDEARLVEHLAECEDCRAELDSHSLTASHLASLADDAETAPPSWSTIRAGVVKDAPASVAVLADHRGRRPAQWLLAAAAAVVVLAGATVASWQVFGSGGGSAAPQSALSHCAHVSGCQEINLRSTSDGVRRAAVIVSDGTARVQPIALRAPAAGHTFVLWQLPRGGAPIALGEFGSTKSVSAADVLAVPIGSTTAFAVSSEPADTPPTTPTDVLALGSATA